MPPPPDFHASMLRVLTTLDELAAIFMRLDTEIRVMARAGLDEAAPERQEGTDA